MTSETEMMPLTIPALLAHRAARAPHGEALVDETGRIDWAGLEARSAARAAWLVARGVNKTHRVGLLAPNGIDWAITAMAVMRIGAVLVPLSTLLRGGELHDQLAAAGVRHLIAAKAFRGRDYQAELAALDRAALPNLHNLWWLDDLGEEAGEAAQAVAAALALRVVPADDMAVIFTSGSRAAPRGVIHTHGAGLRSVAAGVGPRCVREGTRLYIPMPFFWVGGFATGLVTALVAGATLLTEAVPEPARTLKFLEAEKVTLFRGWPDQAAALARHPDFPATDLSGLTAGSLDPVLPPALQARPGARANLFGMTESFGSWCGWPLDQDLPEGKHGSCGKPFSGTLVRVADPASGAILPAGSEGVLQLGGHNLLRGICGLEREAVFTPDGWFATGDMGRIDADGFVWFTGRADDMVKISGATVYPAEVETALQAIPGVARAYATDLAVDGRTAMGAAVVPTAPGTLDLAALVAAAKDRLSAFKVPARWAMLESEAQVPRNGSGKVDKGALQALLAAGQPG
ncbi:class I adenylate-forming enzyme family protein [Novosphingobium bradum]|uniref:Class I adenylate-forming enzyme family protein n=1 Tax=Novosphingobium bradum TaxID=1737444 RepID=A0ABV7IJ46_9SPHN